MDWGNEDWIKLYVRDTPTMLALQYQGRAVLFELLRKVDRAGVIEVGDTGDVGCLPELLRIPEDFFRAGWERLLALGVVTKRDRWILIPNYVDAQEARSSDKQRQKASRERRRDQAKMEEIVTFCDETSRHAVTKRDEHSGSAINLSLLEERRGEESRGESERRPAASFPAARPTQPDRSSACADPSPELPGLGTTPSETRPPRQPRARRTAEDEARPAGWAQLSAKRRRVLERHLPDCEAIWERQTAVRARAIPGSRALAPAAQRLARIAEILEHGATREDCESVLEHYGEQCKRDASQAQWFDGVSNWRPENFDRALGRCKGGKTNGAADGTWDVDAQVQRELEREGFGR